MESSASTIIIVMVLAGVVAVVSLVSLTDRIDNVTQQNVELIVEEFVTDIANTGVLTREKWENFESKIDASGNNSYKLEIEIRSLDENPEKKTAQTNITKIGENVYVILCNTQIFPQIGIATGDEAVDESNDTMLLKEGDIVSVSAESTDPTANDNFESSIFGFSNAGESTISTNYSKMCTVNGTVD